MNGFKRDAADILRFIREYSACDTQSWYPFCCLCREIAVAAYDLDRICNEKKVDVIADVLTSCGIHAVDAVQLQVNGIRWRGKPVKEVLEACDADGPNFPWNAETFYFDDTESWMLYVSHEGTITFTGRKLAEKAREIIPQEYLY